MSEIVELHPSHLKLLLWKQQHDSRLKKVPYQFIIKTIPSYYVIEVTSQCAHLHIILNIQCVQNLFQWHSNMCSFACLYPVINIFLVWSSISWSAELKAVVEPQGDCFVCQLQVSRLAHFIIY